jgi:hypothetical protein
MMFERPSGPKFLEREQGLIARLRKGPEDPEARAMLVQLYKEAEEKARGPEGNRSRAELEMQLHFAEIYRAAGGYDSAWDALEAVRQGAASDPTAEDLYGRAMTMMDEIDAERG